MKKVILSMMLAGGIGAAFAQMPVENGQCPPPDFRRWLMYGDFGFVNQTTSGTANGINNTSWSVNPGIGYRISDCFTVGVQGSYNYQNLSYNSTSNANRTAAWTLGAFVRHHSCEFGKVFSCYTQLNVGYYGVDAYSDQGMFLTMSNTSGGFGSLQVVNGYGVMANLYPALNINVAHGFSLDLNLGGIGYSMLTQNHEGLRNNQLNVSFGQQIQIGLSKEFNCMMGMHRHGRKHMSEAGDDIHSRNFEKMSDEDEEEAPRRSKARVVRDMDDE
jgi:hypothetical protein